MKREHLNWDFIQNNSDIILAGGLDKLINTRPIADGAGITFDYGNYLISNNQPAYIGEAQDVPKRLKQQFRASRSTFYKNYKKRCRSMGIAAEPIENFTCRVISTNIGRKELEEFGIVQLSLPLNKFQKDKRIQFDGDPDVELWETIQENFLELLKEGASKVFDNEYQIWPECKPPKKAGLYLLKDPNDSFVYVGESSNIYKRHKTHSGDTYFSALRRNIGRDIMNFQLKERNGKKKYFTPGEDQKVTNYLNSSKAIFYHVQFGRFELEEHLIRELNPILNRKGNK